MMNVRCHCIKVLFIIDYSHNTVLQALGQFKPIETIYLLPRNRNWLMAFRLHPRESEMDQSSLVPKVVANYVNIQTNQVKTHVTVWTNH